MGQYNSGSPKMRWWLAAGFGPLLVLAQEPVQTALDHNSVEYKATKFVDEAEEALRIRSIESTFASWGYESNITDETKKISEAAQTKHQLMNKKFGKEAQSFDLSKIKDKEVVRKLKLMKNIGTAALPENKLKAFISLTVNMGKTYSTAKVTEFGASKKQLSLEPELTEILAKSRNAKELQYYWEQWRDSSGKKIKNMYHTYVDIYNEAAKLNGFKDASIMKVDPYESDTFQQEMEETWLGLKPLYEQLHAYVRSKLHGFYGKDVVKNSGPLPAHLLGNMWAQSWSNIADILKPYPNKPSINVTGEMIKQGWTPTKMFQKADDFFQSMGLDKMPDKFWSGSILEKPADNRELTCHASAWDFYNGEDFRIKQCTRVNQEDFVTVNHEMGHIQYYLQYKNQSYFYRTGANPGFHEGVADILSLAVGTATYFQRLGLIGEEVDISDEQTNINILFDMALERIAFLPFGYLVDKFRWDVYSGKTSPENMNCHWWKLRNEIQGMTPPAKRSHEQFDAGAKYHVAGDVGYVRYFTAFIYEFQFYRALCLESGNYVPGDPKKPLHRCNFYGSMEAGDKLREMLEMGASRPWVEAMRVMTGQPEMSTKAIREYFMPLEDWLKKENKESGIEVGWGETNVDDLCQTSGRNPRTLDSSPSGAGPPTSSSPDFFAAMAFLLMKSL